MPTTAASDNYTQNSEGLGASDKGSADGHNKSAEPSQTIDGIESNWDEVIGSFDGLDLKEDLLRAGSSPMASRSPPQSSSAPSSR